MIDRLQYARDDQGLFRLHVRFGVVDDGVEPCGGLSISHSEGLSAKIRGPWSLSHHGGGIHQLSITRCVEDDASGTIHRSCRRACSVTYCLRSGLSAAENEKSLDVA